MPSKGYDQIFHCHQIWNEIDSQRDILHRYFQPAGAIGDRTGKNRVEDVIKFYLFYNEQFQFILRNRISPNLIDFPLGADGTADAASFRQSWIQDMGTKVTRWSSHLQSVAINRVLLPEFYPLASHQEEVQGQMPIKFRDFFYYFPLSSSGW